MSTSGTVTFTVNRDQMITQALIDAGVVDPENGNTPTANQITNSSLILNMMLKAWGAYGLHLWEKRYVALFLNLNQGEYIFGSPGPAGDNACLSTPLGTGFVQTTLSTIVGLNATLAAVSTTATPGVPAITIGSGWNIGIQNTDGSFFWTTTTGAPTGLVVPLTAAPTIPQTGGIVYAYQTKMTKFLRITDGFVRQVATNSDVPLMVIPREQYNRFGQKSSQGTSIQVMYDPQLNNGQLYVYPVPPALPGIMYLEVQKMIEDVSTATDNFDVPQEWLEAIKYNLAYRCSISFSSPQDKVKNLAAMAGSTLNLVLGWDVEPTSITITPNNWDYHNDGNN